MDEHRHLIRVYLSQYLTVKDRQTDQVLGYAKNIHTEGMLILSEEPIPVEQSFDLVVEVPGRPSIELTAECVWTESSIDPQFEEAELETVPHLHDNGFSFARLSAHVRNQIEELTGGLSF